MAETAKAEAAAPAPKPRQGRSPAYPFIPLRKALDRAETFRVAEGGRPKHFAPITSAARAWGIGVKTGVAIQTIAALGHFGLFEFQGTGDSRAARMTDAALRILLDKQEVSPERDTLLQKAALTPAIHLELWNKWGVELPSQSTLETYLVRDRGFSENGARDLIAEYKETLAFAKLTQPVNLSDEFQETGDSGSKSMTIEEFDSGAKLPASARGAQRQNTTVFRPASGAEPFRISFNGGSIEVTGRFNDPQSADELIRAIEALKLLLRPAGEAKRSTVETPDIFTTQEDE